jgi:hypothetical protein
MAQTCGLLSGSEHLTQKRNILNLWTETEEWHLGHLHTAKTARCLIDKGHQVTFYVGEFPSNFWTRSEFNRRFESYQAASKLLEAVVPNARTDKGFESTDKAEVTQRRLRHGILREKIINTEPLDPSPKPSSDELEGLLYAYEKLWGGQGSPFFALFSMYVRERKYDSLLIANRHIRIARALNWFAKVCDKTELALLIVDDIRSIDGNPMKSQHGPIRMQEPKEYLLQSLQVNKDAARRNNFIRQICRRFMESARGDDDFDAWWAKEEPTLCAAPDFKAFIDRSEAEVFEEYRRVVYSVLPGTRDETHQRLNNKVLMRYVGLTVQEWKRAGGADDEPLAPWARDVDEDIDANAGRFEASHYKAAFDAVESRLKGYQNSGLGFSREVVDKLLTLTSANRTTDLFLFFGAKKTHRDHYVHTFNVAALGQFLLDLYVLNGRQLKDHLAEKQGCSIADVEMTWWLTAMLHDHAYPIYSMMDWMVRLEELAKAFPGEADVLVELAMPHVMKLPAVHEDIRRPLLDAVKNKMFGLQLFWASTEPNRRELFWFLDPPDLDAIVKNRPIDHAFAAVLNIVLHLQPFKKTIVERHLIRQLLRGILFHTKLKLSQDRVADIHWEKDPFAYILLVCDELQEWSRRSLRPNDPTLRATRSELLVSPLHRRLDRADRWHVPANELDVTVRYFDVTDLKGWDSHTFHREKDEMFKRLLSTPGAAMPVIRLYYGLATPKYPDRNRKTD